jgi:signal transduction histidine kinase
MDSNAKRAMLPGGRSAVLATADSELAQRVTAEVERFGKLEPVCTVPGLAQLRDRLREIAPRVIFLDGMLLGEAPVVESLRQLTETAPVVFLDSYACQAQVSRLVAEGDVELVVRMGDFIPHAAGLIERRLRWAERPGFGLGPPSAGLTGDIPEIFRHEINNPLTGILGNAELLLAHGDRLTAIETQRLHTVVDLAVRLRENVRRLSNAWEAQAHALKSA